jgi:CheY-like chemotaxis protein
MSATVLIIDDDVDIREALGMALSNFGYDVMLAENGAVALQMVRDRAPGLILLDLMMPVMDGAQFHAAIQHDPVLASIPLVVLSGHGQVATQAATMGTSAYLVKPIDLKQLLDVVERFTGRAPRRRSTE